VSPDGPSLVSPACYTRAFLGVNTSYLIDCQIITKEGVKTAQNPPCYTRGVKLNIESESFSSRRWLGSVVSFTHFPTLSAAAPKTQRSRHHVHGMPGRR
jgi:hypothetical protein